MNTGNCSVAGNAGCSTERPSMPPADAPITTASIFLADGLIELALRAR